MADGRLSTHLPLPRLGAGKGLNLPLLDFLDILATILAKTLQEVFWSLNPNGCKKVAETCIYLHETKYAQLATLAT